MSSTIRAVYLLALVAAGAGAVWSVTRDLDSLTALIPLLATVIAPLAAATVSRRRALIVSAALFVQFGIVFLGQFTIGLLFLPSAVLLVVGGCAELAIGVSDRPERID